MWSGFPTADRCILVMCRQAMFSLCMVESEADEVTLQGVTSVGLKHALDFAYTGQVSMSNCLHSWKDKGKRNVCWNIICSISISNSNTTSKRALKIKGQVLKID